MFSLKKSCYSFEEHSVSVTWNLALSTGGPNRGHYITIVKSHGFWLLFDDDIVEKIDAQAIEEFYGLTSDISKNSESGYILFYQSRE